MSTHGTFQGTSETGNLQEALDKAIAAAQQAQPGADMINMWRLNEVTGRAGGLHPTRSVTVEIETTEPRHPGGS